MTSTALVNVSTYSLLNSPEWADSGAGLLKSSQANVESRPGTGEASVSNIELPQFGNYAESTAATTRLTSRMIAAKISDDEVKKLLNERQLLVDRKLAKTITYKEEIRLNYVRWSLDRIEDARYGESLDRLEEHISRYEHFQRDLHDLNASLLRAAKKRR